MAVLNMNLKLLINHQYYVVLAIKVNTSSWIEMFSTYWFIKKGIRYDLIIVRLLWLLWDLHRLKPQRLNETNENMMIVLLPQIDIINVLCNDDKNFFFPSNYYNVTKSNRLIWCSYCVYKNNRIVWARSTVCNYILYW